MSRQCHTVVLAAFLVLVALVLPADSFGAEPPISIVCPCNVERVNQTKAVAKFSVAFDKEVSESGEFLVEIARRDTIGNQIRTMLSRVTTSSLTYSSESKSLEISLPFFADQTKGNQFLSLSIRSLDKNLIDLVVLNEKPLTIGGRYGVNYSADNQIVFDTPVSFQYDSSSFSFAVAKVSNINLKNVSDVVTVEVSVANAEGSYYTKAEVETTVKYDAQGKGSLSVSGELSRAMDSHLAADTGHTNIRIRIFRDASLLLRYQVGVLQGGSMPTFALNLNNIDTLIDSDNDGITDFNERLIGTSSEESNSVGPVPIEVAFTYGTSAQDNEGDGLQARLAFITAVANTALADSGVNVVIQTVGSYEVGEDGSLTADQVLEALQGRGGIFSGLDDVLDRKPDFFIHLSTVAALDAGGKAPVFGGRQHGILDYQNYYSVGSNGGTVAIENVSLSLMHELGHLMGLGHARRQYEDGPAGTFRWSSGYGVDNDFATLMAYRSSFGSASSVGFFSSPALKCGLAKLPCGVERGDYLNGADSVSSLAVTALQASAISNGFPPGITLTGDKTVTIAIGQTYSEPGFSAYDKEDGNLTPSVVATNNIDNTKSGTYTVTYEVSDADGNKSSATRAVLVAWSEDTDHDGLPDEWETANGRDPLVADYMVSANYYHTCALDDTGVVCWGYNGFGQATVPTLTNPTQVSAGNYHTCALDDTGVVCWGSNVNGKTTVPTLTNPTQVSLGTQNSCALDDTGVVCWGDNGNGQTDVPALSNPTQVSGGGYHSCALDDTGVVCWGDNGNGQTDVPALSNTKQVSPGGYHTCALDDTGVVCWGRNHGGQTDVPALSNPTQVSLGGSHTCALNDTGVVCWGSNYYGQTDVPVLSNPTQVLLGANHTCALDDTGVVCWGSNDSGQATVPSLVNDPDGDGFSNQGGADVFPLDATEWLDTDLDGIGNNRDTDDDGDSISDVDEIQNGMNPFLADTDGDGVNDDIDVFPTDSAETIDTDGDLTGNNADLDDDGDSISDLDEIQNGTNPLLTDTDGDGVNDNIDTYPLISLGVLIDTDADGRPDDCDSDCIALGMAADDDDDNDGVMDTADAYPLISLSDLTDTDGDGRPGDCDTDCTSLGMAADDDDDNDGVLDTGDAYPLISLNGLTDTDGDGRPDNCDTDCTSLGMAADDDDDNDGFSDAQEAIDSTDPLDKDDCATCTPPVSGIAYHWNNNALLESVDVSLVGLTDGIENDFAEQSLSSASGQYAFTQKHRGTNHMTASKAISTGESGSVISSADALAALKIAVGINPNTDPDGAGPEEALPVSPYQYIAADINGDGRITSADALAILKMAVKLDTAEPRRWVFVAEDYEFWDQASKSFKTTRTDVAWDSDGMIFDYPEKSVQNVVGVLMGDVNGNWSAPEGGEALGESYLSELIKSQGGSLAQWGKYDTQSAVAQPNILLIIADDQGVDASAQYPLSVDVPTTPTLNKLASEGIVFDNAWATPACTTSRATMMTGQYGVNSGVVSNDDSVSSNALTLHRYLANSPNSSNYASALIGKWGLGGSGVAANHPATLGIEYFAGTLRRAISDYNAWDLTVNGVTTATSVYNTTASTDLAIDWIANQAQPWFLWLAYTAPHDPIHVPPEHLHTRNLSGTDSDISSNPRAYYLAAIEAMDSEIGRLLQSFDQQQLENTIIFYVGDNGTPTSVIDTTVFSKGKSSVSEGGLKVPMVVSGSGVSRENSRESALINVTDFFATISQLAGNDTPQISDSVSFMRLLSNADSPSREYSYVDFMTNGITRWAIRDERYKLIVSSSGSKQLYDLLNDPYEDTNLIRAGDQYQSIESRLFTAGMAIRPQTDGAVHTAGIECSYSYDVFNDSAWVDMQSWAHWQCDESLRTLMANGVPDHAVGRFPNANNPNSIAAQTISETFTLSPEKTSLSTTLGGPRGATGYVLNGVKIDAGTAGTCSDNGTSCRLAPPMQGSWSIEALGQDSFDFGDDENHAHVQPTGAYHYHGIPEGFVSKLNKGEAMTHIGWAADGFPIYARYGYSDPTDSDSSIVVVQSSYQLKTSPDVNRAEVSMYPMGTFTQDYEYVEGSGHLDECNGREGVTPEFPQGIYHYFATDTFPFLQRCVRGGL